jgi:asparagine synthase (glutamine-hydrolysing)
MCGIAGKVSARADALPDPGLLDAQLQALEHRGPDSAGRHVDGAVAIGMRRLAIIDVEGGGQPLYSEDGQIALVLNGELYTFRAQRAALERRGHRFATGSDAEIAVHLYQEHGPDFVEHLHGMFALALWDARRRRLVLARDRMGKKPLLWAHDRDGAVVFASEPRAVLMDRGVSRDLDLAALDATLVTQYVPADRTPWRSVHQLAPAGRLVWDVGVKAPVVDRWWAPEWAPKQVIGLQDAAELLRHRLRVAVRMRLEAEVPIGAFLSGGVDSSAVVAAMAQEAPGRVRTFAARFEDSAYDEGPWARAVAEHWDTDHTELHVGPVDEDTLGRLVWHLGVPLADPAAVPAFQLAELAAREVTVALTGDGGDELFGGYRRHHHLAWTRAAQAVPLNLRRRLARAPYLPERPRRLARRLAMAPPERYADLFRHFTDQDRRALYGPALAPLIDGGDPLRAVREAWDDARARTWTDRVLACDQGAYLAGDLLPKADLTSMAHGLELRSPLLDQDIVEWAATLPPSLKRRGTAGKRVLRAAAAPWLPKAILDRPKQGFAVPVGAWLRGPLRELAHDILLDRRTRDRGLIDTQAAAATLRAHQAGQDRAAVLWSMLVLELWCRTCDRAPAAGRDRALVS